MSADTLQGLRENEKFRKIDMRAPTNAIKAEIKAAKKLNADRIHELYDLYMTAYKKIIPYRIPCRIKHDNVLRIRILKILHETGKLQMYIELLKQIFISPYTVHEAAIFCYLPYSIVVTICLENFGVVV